jgi:3-oxoacyl-[acyl-carrier protein] reductase
MEINLKGKRALVCGGSDGIGKAIAGIFARSGTQVILAARSEEKLQTVLKELPGDGHSYIIADFSRPEALEKKVKPLVSERPVHILINNSGGPAPGNISDADPESLQTAFNSHVISSQILSAIVLEGMKKEKYGRIINIVSTSVREPIKGLGVSNTIRAAIAGWAKTLSSEVAPFGINVNNILPGYTNTARLRSLIEKKAMSAGKTIDEIKREMLSEIPAGRFAEPEEPAALALFLASPFASYITGVSIQVDGGKMKSI